MDLYTTYHNVPPPIMLLYLIVAAVFGGLK
jgi:hypothetical protein